MAGAYPDPLGVRIPYDRDGTVVSWSEDGVHKAIFSQTQRQNLNDETTSNFGFGSANGNAASVNIVFPVVMDIKALYFSAGQTSRVDYSNDTTSGVDGTWTTVVTSVSRNIIVGSTYRSAAYIASGAGFPFSAKAVRVYGLGDSSQNGVRSVHLYGNKHDLVGNWLRLWHPTLDQPYSDTPAVYDVGDAPRGIGAKTISFRIKNCSATLTANAISLARDVLTESTPANLPLWQVRYNGGAYANTALVGNLGPGSISAICDGKLDVTIDAGPGLYAPRITATPGSWS